MEYGKLTFEHDDKIHRKMFAQSIMNAIEKWADFKQQNESIVVSINAPWGSGKSYLLNMWKNWLMSEGNRQKKYAVVYYNAWENDDCENAFIPLVFSLQQLDSEDEQLKEILVEKTKSFVKACAISLLKDGIKKTIGEETSNLICSGIDASAESSSESFFKSYNEYMKQKDKFQRSLSLLVPDGGKLIVFIDELDRCRPHFAVETLELVKHFFNVDNIVFIFAVDFEQLSHSISTMYGAGMDSSGYLRRFFDIEANIPSCNVNEYVDMLFSNFIKGMPYLESFKSTAANIFAELKLSLRDMDKIINNFIVFCLYYDKYIEALQTEQFRTKIEAYLYFMVLKYKFPNTYKLLIQNDFICYDNEPKNWEVINMKFFISSNIRILLNLMQTGNSRNPEKLVNFKEYVFEPYVKRGDSFSSYIERMLEIFIR